jgi:hypothetical protein
MNKSGARATVHASRNRDQGFLFAQNIPNFLNLFFNEFLRVELLL